MHHMLHRYKRYISAIFNDFGQPVTLVTRYCRINRSFFTFSANFIFSSYTMDYDKSDDDCDEGFDRSLPAQRSLTTTTTTTTKDLIHNRNNRR